MSTTSSSRQGLLLAGAALIVFFGLVAVFLGPNLFKERPTNWGWYFLHIGGGALVLGLGPFQFIAPLRNRFRRYHRVAGYTYVLGSAMAVLGFIGMPKTEAFLTSQLMALALWVLCVGFAIRAILARQLLAHQHNMARSFVLACYFLTGRLVDRFAMGLLVPLAADEGIRYANSDWLAWLVPLLAVEVYFTLKWQSALAAKTTRRA